MALLGIDEVGRGPWAGPLVMGAVILGSPRNPLWDELTDSKKLTKLRREKLAPKIREQAFATGLGWVYTDELNELGLSKGLRLAASRAVADCLKNSGIKKSGIYLDHNQIVKLPQNFPVTEIIIDGTTNFLKDTSLEQVASVLPKADLLIKEVSAASIIAKVARDNYMTEVVAKNYPEYGFETHVGYGTARHQEALRNYGPCPEHRTFVRPVAKHLGLGTSKQTPKNTSRIGHIAEGVAAKYLEANGHKIIARNYKTKIYEIDIISATKDHIYFTEVKYRKTQISGSPLEVIDKQKRQKMAFAARAFMEYLAKRLGRNPETLPSPVLAAASVSGPDFKLETWFPVV